VKPARVTAVVLLILYLGVGVFDHEIWAPTEPTVSGIVWSMVDSGELAVPRINGLPYLEKPPLYYWAAWASARLAGGLSAGSLRLPAALFGLLALFALYRTLRLRHSEWTACAATLLVATILPFYELSHRASTDIAATAASFVCFALFARSLVRDPAASGSALLDAVFAGVLAASFFAKNFYTLFIVIPPVLVMLAWRREWKRGFWMLAVGSLAFLVLVGPWVWDLYEAGGIPYLRVVFFDNTLGRFLALPNPGFDPGPLNDAFVAEKQGSLFFYLARLPAVLAPWTLLVGLGALRMWRARPLDDLRRFAALGLLLIPLLLSLSSSKVTEYVTPVVFFAGLILAEWLASLEVGAAPVRFERWVALGSLAGVGLVLGVAPLALAALRGVWPWALATPLLGGLAWWLGRGLWRGASGVEAWGRASLALAAGLTLCLAAAIPLLDAHKSYAPFFAQARREAQGRRVVTPLLGDHSLPLMTYYLRRRVDVLDEAQVRRALAGSEPVLAILRARSYDEARERVDGIPGVRVSPVRGHGKLVLAVNHPPR